MALKFLFIFTVSLRSFHFLICKTWFACEDLQLRVGRKNVILCWHLAHLANNHLSVTGKPFLSDECMSLPSWLAGWPSFGSWLQLLPVRGVCIHCVSFCSACAQPFWDSLFAASISLPLVSVALLGCEFLCVLGRVSPASLWRDAEISLYIHASLITGRVQFNDHRQDLVCF